MSEVEDNGVRWKGWRFAFERDSKHEDMLFLYESSLSITRTVVVIVISETCHIDPPSRSVFNFDWYLG